jgi:cyanophycin synthetase
MKILETKVMRGPNYWSNYRKKLIVIKLDLGELEASPTHKIDGFKERLLELIPSLWKHRCSPGYEGGFAERLERGTWLGHVVEHVALEIQSLAGMDCGYGRTRNAGEKGVYHVVFTYETEKAGLYAAKAAVNLVEAMVAGTNYDLQQDIDILHELYLDEKFGPSTQSIVDEAVRRNIPYTRLDAHSRVMLGQGVNQKIFCATIAGSTSNLGVELACDKEATKRILSDAFIPVPQGGLIYDEEELDAVIDKIGFPMVIKPVDGNHGRGITTNILNRETALTAFQDAKKISRKVIVEKFIKGNDHRFLLVNYKLVAVAKRVPAKVIGDGRSTIAELVDEVNADPERGEGHAKNLTKIKVDEHTLSIIQDRGYDMETILQIGEILYLKDTANLSTGGTAQDVTDIVHPENVFMAERVARLMQLDICGIDVMAEDITKPLTKHNGAILEVNACPGFRMHNKPSSGIQRNVASHVLDMFYPKQAESRIPIVAVTGTNGKTTTTRLIAHMAQAAGKYTGYTTTDGIYINGHMITSGDCSGPTSATTILKDPSVDFAVFETARGGILRSGLAFDHCNISIITNLTGDHLGLKDIHTIEQLARVKEVVVQSTFDKGYAILNADDDLVYAMKNDLSCNVALFSLDSESERITSHCEAGGLAAVVDNGYLTIIDGKWKTRLVHVKDIPLTLSGHAVFNIQNILPSVITAILSNFGKQNILDALKSFFPSPEMTPGRMNTFNFANHTVVLDYAHNEGCFREIEKYMAHVDVPRKIGIIAATGDRREEDIHKIGYYAARIFDEIIIRHDKDGRGRSQEELTSLLLQGIQQHRPDMMVQVISDEQASITHATTHAVPGSLIFVCTDDVHESIRFMKELQEKNLVEHSGISEAA